MATGTYSIDTLLAARFTSAKEFGLDNIAEILNAELAAHNALVSEALMEMAEPTTDAQSVYGSSVGGNMVEVDEFGSAPSQRATPGSTVGFPLKLKQYNLGWTERFLLRATPADLAIMTRNAQVAHQRALMADMKRAIYGSSNYTFTDHLVDNIAITVRRFLNADGEAIPAGPNGEIYDGASETHYVANSTLTAAKLKEVIVNVIEKGHGSNVKVAISTTDETAVRNLTGFVAYIDPRHTHNANTNEGVPRLDVTRVDNRAIGTFEGAEVWVKPWAIANYAFAWDAGAAGKPLKYRQDRVQGLQGLRIAAENSSYPLYARFMEASFGFGVWTRTNGSVLYFGGASYTDPTITG